MMPWLEDSDAGAAQRAVWGILEAQEGAESRRRALDALAACVADVVSWDRVELATGAVRHEAVPPGPSRPGRSRRSWAPRQVTRCWPRTPPAASRAAPLRGVEERGLLRSELYGDLLHRSGVEYGIAISITHRAREAVVAGLGRTEREFSERDRDSSIWCGPASRPRCASGGARAPRPRARRRSAAGHRRGPARRLRRDRALEPRRRALARRALRGGRAPGLATRAGRRVAGAAAAAGAGQRARRPASHRPLLPGDPHALLLEEEVASVPRRRARPARPDPARDRGAARGRRDGGRGGHRLGAVPQPSCRPRAARALEAKLGVRTAAEAVARALRESA